MHVPLIIFEFWRDQLRGVNASEQKRTLSGRGRFQSVSSAAQPFRQREGATIRVFARHSETALRWVSVDALF